MSIVVGTERPLESPQPCCRHALVKPESADFEHAGHLAVRCACFNFRRGFQKEPIQVLPKALIPRLSVGEFLLLGVPVGEGGTSALSVFTPTARSEGAWRPLKELRRRAWLGCC